MKKRIFMLALVVGVTLSVCASACAATNSIKLDSVKPGYTAVNNVNTTSGRIGKSFTIAVKASIGGFTQDENASTYSTNAQYIEWSVTQEPTENEGTPPVANLAIASTNSALASQTSTTKDYEKLVDSKSSALLSANLTGTIQATGTVKITAKLVTDTNGTEADGEAANRTISNVTVTFAAADADDVKTTDTTLFTDSTENPDLFDTYDKRDPDSVEWDGSDPIFYNTISSSTDIGKNKPKLGKIDKSALTLESGKEAPIEVPLVGPITEVDVYIAQKDAKKLYPASADAIKANIRLTSASIKQYGIPFRVTAHKFATKTDTTGTDADAKKAQAKEWKSAENSLTIKFNGGNLQYKGFPITISMKNKNTTSKPVAKAIKINVGDPKNFTTPVWTHEVLSTDTTTDPEKYAEWEDDEETVDLGTYPEDKWTSKGNEVNGVNIPDGKTVGETFVVTTGEGESAVTKLYIVSTDNKVFEAEQVIEYYWRKYYATKTLEKKDKPEAVTYVVPDTKKTGTIEAVFTASGDAPYAITLKPDTTKDADKLKKFFTSVTSIDVVQPVYNFLGNVTTHGYVKIVGVPKETAKESKLAMTLTAANPSTKKKAAAKVTAIAKTFPVFDKTASVKIVGDNDEEKDEYVYPYGYESSDKTYKRITTKRVEAGKAPSVKPKAKGSKTISYKLGKYVYEDDDNGELVDYFDSESFEDEDEQYTHTALAKKLVALGLSFDEKKGVYAPDKNSLSKPTLNSDGDAFQSLDIVITAVNSVGTDHAWAHVAITGAKPKVSDKTVTVEGTKKLGDTITFAVLAGKTAATDLTSTNAANVKVTAGDSAAKSTLAKYGLALVTYDSMDVIVSKEITYTAGTVLPTSFVKKDDGSNIKTGSVTALVDGDDGYEAGVTKYKAGDEGVTILSGDTWAKGKNDKLQNYGILQVIDQKTLASKSKDKDGNKGVSINLTLENLGSTNKGKIKVVIKDTVNGGDPTKPVVTTTTTTTDSSSESNGAAPKTNGTASLTYNGAAPDADAEAEAEAEGTVTFGTPRTVADLTAGQQAFLAEKGYTVVAVLPEITADVSDQYKLENIELDEDAPEGATLIWIAFPKNAPASEDDEIVDFYDEAGTPVEGVPASHKIIAVPWLREAVTYEPVIAIEAK